jgi:hypothetical protein
MHVRVGDPQLEEALLAFLEERGCVVEELADNTLRIGAPPSMRSDRADFSVAGYLNEWLTWHPETMLYIDDAEAGPA